MKTFKIESDWGELKQYVIDNLSNYKGQFQILYREQESKENDIYLRSIEEGVIDSSFALPGGIKKAKKCSMA